MLSLSHTKGVLEAGCDEAGRGCLAGPVYAAAVILPSDFKNELLTDSKQLTDKQRYRLRPIIEKKAIAWAVGVLSNERIDEVNILKASFFAMHQAISKLNVMPEELLIDGNRFIPYGSIPHHCIIKGDEKYLSIAAASILAKTYRDDHMKRLHEQHPHYGWNRNMGYPTPQHRDAIREHNISPFHRKSFRLLPEQLKLSL